MNFLAKYKTTLFLAGVFIFMVGVLHPNHGFIQGHTSAVGSHNIALTKNTKVENAFVGYTWPTKTADGTVFYDYFVRSPAFTYVLMVIGQRTFADSTVDEIVHARTFMNFINFIVLALSFALIYKITGLFYVAASAVLIAFSSQYFLLYKHMPCPDIFTNLGFITCIWGFYAYENGKKWLGIALILLSVNLGWGYSQLPIIGLWAGWSFFKDRQLKPALINIKMLVFISSIIFIVLNLAHNIYYEARANHVSVSEVGIIQSAKRRLSLDASFNETFPYPFYRYIPKIISRVHRGFSLPDVDAAMVFIATPFLGFLLYGLYRFMKGAVKPSFYAGPNKMYLLLLLFSGFLWALPMKSLFVHHGYTSMGFFGFTVVGLSLAIIALLKSEKHQQNAFFFCLAYFLTVHLWYYNVENKQAQPNEIRMEEMAKIESYLSATPGQSICLDKSEIPTIVLSVPYDQGIFLADHFITDTNCTYRISKDPAQSAGNLIAENKNMFLMKVSDAGAGND